MTLFKNEFRKLFSGPLVIILLAVLMVTNAVTCFVLTPPAEEADEKEARLIELAEKYYREDPDGLTTYYLEMSKKLEVYLDELQDYTMNSMGSRPGRPGASQEEVEVPEPPVPPVFLYTYSEEVNDYELLHMFFSKVENTANYPDHLKRVIISITRTLEYQETFEGYEDTYAYREQREMLTAYLKLLREYTPTLSIVKGWDSYFSYQEGNIFLMLALLVIGCQLVLPDYTGQMMPVVRATKRGRFHTSVAKLTVGILVTLPIAACFKLAEIAAIYAKQGLSSPLAAIQNMAGFQYSPYPITIFIALILQLMLCWLGGALFLFSVASLARLFCRPIPTYAGGFVVFAVHLLLHFFKTHAEFFSLNVFSLGNGLTEIKQTAYFRIWEMPYPKLPTMALVIGVMLAVVAIAFLLLATFHRGQPVRVKLRISHKDKAEVMVKSVAKKTRKVRSYPMSPFLFEGMKHLRLRTVLLVIIIALCQIYSTWTTFSEPLTPNEKLWESYQEQYAGEVTSETAEEIRQLDCYYALLRDESTTIKIDAAVNTPHDLENGILYFDCVETYISEMNTAYLRQPVMERLTLKLDYLKQKAEHTGTLGYMMKDTGILRMTGQSMNVGLYLILLLLLSNLFGYEGKFAPILRISSRGRAHTWKAKLVFSTLISLGFALFFTAVDWIAYLSHFALIATSAPLFSLQAYGDVNMNITVGGYLILVTLLRIVAALLWGMLIAGLSGCLYSARLTLLLSGTLTLLPMVLYYCGINFCRYLDFTKLLAGDALWLLSWEGSGWGLLIGFVAVVAAICAGLITASYQKFCK